MQTKQKFTRMAMFVALAMILSYVEFLIPIPLPIPGIKLGLANLVILIPLYLWGFKPAFVISMLRVLLVGITFGSPSTMLYSMAGAVLSLLVMSLVYKVKFFSPVGVSILGGVFHNVGQLVTAMLVVQNVKLLSYLPVLLIAGGITGFIIGMLVIQVLQRLRVDGINEKK